MVQYFIFVHVYYTLWKVSPVHFLIFSDVFNPVSIVFLSYVWFTESEPYFVLISAFSDIMVTTQSSSHVSFDDAL